MFLNFMIEAAQLSSQITNIIFGGITTHFVFKFSACPSSNAGQEVSKNGLHWGELYNDPYPISDTTLSAEHYRLLTKMIGSTIYVVKKNDSATTSMYLSSYNNDGFYYLYAVNDQNNTLTLNIDPTAFGPISGTDIIAEAAGPGYWGEIYGVYPVPTASPFTTILNQYTTLRFAIPIGQQSITTTNALLTCTAQAGENSNTAACSSENVLTGTSNTAAHEQTSVALLKFNITNFETVSQKTLLKVNIEQIVGNSSVTVMILGIVNPTMTLNAAYASWNSLTNMSASGLNILNVLTSGKPLANITDNFINWNSQSNITIVGHLTGTVGVVNQQRMVDVTDYVNNVIKAGGTTLTFFMYRPFRHPNYLTGNGNVTFDNLSYGSLIQISGVNGANPPQLLTYYNPSLKPKASVATLTGLVSVNSASRKRRSTEDDIDPETVFHNLKKSVISSVLFSL
jgi:hypothetical protein